jgi:hypothetical protein
MEFSKEQSFQMVLRFLGAGIDYESDLFKDDLQQTDPTARNLYKALYNEDPKPLTKSVRERIGEVLSGKRSTDHSLFYRMKDPLNKNLWKDGFDFMIEKIQNEFDTEKWQYYDEFWQQNERTFNLVPEIKNFQDGIV